MKSSEDLLLAYGIDVKSTATTSNANTKSILEPKTCPHCSEPNKPDAKFCMGCKMVLTLDAYTDTKNEAEETKKKLEELEAKQEILQANAANVFRALMREDMKVKSPPVEIITWNAKEGSEGLFKAAAIARAENQKREMEHQQRHHDLNNRRPVI
jgi:Asp-tRNA(Asn)/Glu-tRNA(Gln) amidotransferase C subunit